MPYNPVSKYWLDRAEEAQRIAEEAAEEKRKQDAAIVVAE